MQTHTDQYKASFFKRFLFIKIVIAAVVIQILGALPAFSSMGGLSGWYQTLNKPNFNPPNWLFGPVWSALFLLMGISVGIVWHKFFNIEDSLLKTKAKRALSLFIIHMSLNMMWTILFFGLQLPTLALIDIVILWFFILGLILIFKPISKLSAILLIPYILWVSFAIVLNASIVYLN